MACLSGCITINIVMLMGMENMYTAMLDYPDEFHKVMSIACENYESYFNWLSAEDLLYPTNTCQPLAMDTYAYTNQLPDNPKSTGDLWGHINNQESVGISPDMFGEFIFPYIKRVASRIGLISYGCCEPVHPLWDKYISAIKNVQRVSISPWCDEEFMAERLRGSSIVYHRKPPSTFLVTKGPLDETAVKEYFTKTALTASGCLLEITQREVLTIYGDVERVRRYISLIKETVNRHWKP